MTVDSDRDRRQDRDRDDRRDRGRKGRKGGSDIDDMIGLIMLMLFGGAVVTAVTVKVADLWAQLMVWVDQTLGAVGADVSAWWGQVWPF